MDDYTAKPAGDESAAGDAIDHDDLLIRVKDWFLEDGPHCRKWHTVAKEEFGIRAGEQWDKDDKLILEEQKRPPSVFNRIDPVIDAVVGQEITNRQEVRYIPRQVADGPINEVYTEAARWFRDQCDAEHEESHAFADAATVGMGWTETRLDYEENPDGDPSIDRIDPIEMFWDCAARAANLTDARRLYRVRRKVPIEEVKALFPVDKDGRPFYDDSCYDATWAAGDTEDAEQHDNPTSRYRHRDEDNLNDDEQRDMVTLVQVQWFEREPYYRGTVIDPMGLATGAQPQTVELTEDEHAVMQERAPQLGQIYRGVRQVRKCFYKAFLGGEVLEVTKIVAPSGKPAQSFTFVPITGKLDRNLGHFYGLVRGMKGPQQWANKLLSTVIEIMARSAKGGVMYEAGTVENAEEFEASWAKVGANSEFKKGALQNGAVIPKPASQVPPDLIQIMQFSITAIRDVTGMNVESMGLADREQAASLEYQRRQSAQTILAPIFDSLRRYRRIQGRALLFLITEYLSDGRLIRIVGDEGDKYVQLSKQEGATEYDVIVDDAPSSPSQKELVWNSFTQLMPLIQHMQPPPGVIMALLDYSMLPASVVAKIKQEVATAQQNAPPPPPDPLTIKAEEAKIDMAMAQQKNQTDMQIAHEKSAMDQQKSTLELQIEREKAMLELQIMREKAAIDLQSKTAMAQLQMRTKADASRQDLELKEQAVEHEATGEGKRDVAQLTPLLDKVFAQLAQLQAKTADDLRKDISRPRKRTLVRGKDGRASHAIDEVINEG